VTHTVLIEGFPIFGFEDIAGKAAGMVKKMSDLHTSRIWKAVKPTFSLEIGSCCPGAASSTPASHPG